MLSEERVKYMTKLAFYETKSGSEDLRVTSYYKNDYIGFHSFWSGLCMTIAYIILVLLIIFTYMNEIWPALTSGQLLVIILSFLGIYFILLFAYIRYSRGISKKKHARAYHRVKKFKEELEHLEKMYEKEDDQ